MNDPSPESLVTPSPNLAKYTQYQFYANVVQFILTGAVWVYVWLSNRVRVNHRRFGALEKRVEHKLDRDQVNELIGLRLSDCESHRAQTNRLEATTARLGAELRKIPRRDDLAQIEKRLGQIQSNVARLEGRFEGIDRLTNLLNEYMVTQGNRQP